MKNLLQYLTENLVNNPSDVKIEEENNESFTRLKLSVHKDDMGRIIGRGGKIIQALRNLLKIKAIKEGKQVQLELVEES